MSVYTSVYVYVCLSVNVSLSVSLSSYSILACLSKTTGRTVRCMTEDEAMEAVMAATAQNSHHQWDFDMTFADSHQLAGLELKYPNGMMESCAQV
mgnify:CR=1 FL=1